MNLRKIVTVSASALLLLSVGASASTCTASNASASRVSRLEARKSRDYRDIRSINSQLAKLHHHNKRGYRHTAHRNRRRAPRRHRAKRARKHESEAQYYKNNASKWHYTYLNDKHEAFKKGFNDGDDVQGIVIPSMNPKYVNNSMYRKGWVIGYIYHDNTNDPDSLNDLSVKEVSKSLHVYNIGVDYVKVHHSTHKIEWNAYGNDEWGK